MMFSFISKLAMNYQSISTVILKNILMMLTKKFRLKPWNEMKNFSTLFTNIR